jgi:hypothetical protein
MHTFRGVQSALCACIEVGNWSPGSVDPVEARVQAGPPQAGRAPMGLRPQRRALGHSHGEGPSDAHDAQGSVAGSGAA